MLKSFKIFDITKLPTTRSDSHYISPISDWENPRLHSVSNRDNRGVRLCLLIFGQKCHFTFALGQDPGFCLIFQSPEVMWKQTKVKQATATEELSFSFRIKEWHGLRASAFSVVSRLSLKPQGTRGTVVTGGWPQGKEITRKKTGNSVFGKMGQDWAWGFWDPAWLHQEREQGGVGWRLWIEQSGFWVSKVLGGESWRAWCGWKQASASKWNGHSRRSQLQLLNIKKVPVVVYTDLRSRNTQLLLDCNSSF